MSFLLPEEKGFKHAVIIVRRESGRTPHSWPASVHPVLQRV